ncbi:UbiA family prenyltransferase [Calditrichota bacterium GD2]
MKTVNKQTKWLNYLDYFFVLRPMLFYPGWSTLLAGYLIVFKHRWALTPTEWSELDFGLLAVLFFSFALAMGGSFLLNQLADVESDLKNNKLFLISKGHIPRKNAVLEVIVLLALSLVLALAVDWRIFATSLIFIVITGYLYNFKPFRFKDKPWWSLWANMAMGFLAFCLGWLAVHQQFSCALLLDALPYLLFNTALYFYTTLPDVEGDRAAGKKTLAVQFGIKTIVYVAFLFYLAGLISAVVLQDRLALIMVAPALPFFVWTLLRAEVSATIRATKFSILFFALAVCLKIPFYFALMAGGFYFTRWYFKARFQFDYPNFQGKG